MSITDKWQGKNKAVTFSFDDGVTQDKRLIEILNRYQLKGTFNINSELLGRSGELNRNGRIVSHNKISLLEVTDLYRGHEVAVHTLTHPNLTAQEEEEIVRQVEEDRKNIERLVGYPVRGMAYPCGGVNNDDRVASVLARRTKIKYARTITSSYAFRLPQNLLRLDPTVYYIEEDKLFELGEKFLRSQTDSPQLLYVWGHSYEMDAGYISWERFEAFCRMIAGKTDVFYGTNEQILL